MDEDKYLKWFIVVTTALSLAGIAATVYVIAHFLAKYW